MSKQIVGVQQYIVRLPAGHKLVVEEIRSHVLSTDEIDKSQLVQVQASVSMEREE